MTKITINTPGSGGSTSPGGSNKSVQYNDSGAFGGDVLFNFDETNTRLGIGTTTPSATLNVESANTSVARFESLGVGGGIDLKDQNTTADNYVSIQAIGDDMIFISGGNARARLFSNGNLVIGNALTNSPYKLHIEVTDALIHNVRVGRGGGSVSSNTAVGTSALNVNTTGNNNTALGFNASLVNSIGEFNTSIGSISQTANTTGSFNTSVGSNSLASNTTSSNNTAIGRSSLASNDASNNMAIGFEAGTSNVSGVGLTAIGYQALRASTGNLNTAVGFQAGLVTTVTSGNDGHNAFFGYQAGVAHTTGAKNTFIGSLSGKLITTATDCIAIGYDALGTAVGSNSIAIGSGSRSTSFSIVLGNSTSSTGASCIAIGHGAGTANFTSSIAIGRGATATANNQFVIGSATNNAGTVANLPAAQTHYWTIKINGTDYKVLLAL
jgi:hypothetical protein